jgi:UDP-N-acetyl-D-mannosaminuronic acid dehydrogenase
MFVSPEFPDRRICILGLGYVGLTLAVAMADVGFQVHGIEVREDVLDDLGKGIPHFWEPRLEQKLKRTVANGSFTFSKDTPADLDASVFVITVGTPLNDAGEARLDMVATATRQLISGMKPNALVILRSTVKLGTARNVVKPILEETGQPYMLAMCPERTLEGRALIELHELPQIIGADNFETRNRCQQLFGQMTPTTVAMSSLEAAELVKLVDNTFRDVSFAFANEVAQLCGTMGLSAHEVIRAGKLGYPRTNVALPGPVGGPCLEKDPHILVESARSFGIDMPITHASRRVNEQQPQATIALLKSRADTIDGFPANPKIALLGLAFKGNPATDDLRGTMAQPILQALKQSYPHAAITLYDPVVKPEDAKAFFGEHAADSVEDAVSQSNIVVIANNHDHFRSLEIQSILGQMADHAIVYDYWNLFDNADAPLITNKFYIALGAERLLP